MSEQLLVKALAYANEKHKDQRRKDGTPYIYHPIRVSFLLKERGYDETHQLVGLLHDTLEDTDATIEEIEAFGHDVATAVVLLSKNYAKSVPEGYFEGILGNPIAKAVKTADRIDNIRDSINSGNESFMIKYLKESKQYFLGRFSDELDREIAEYEKLLKDKGII